MRRFIQIVENAQDPFVQEVLSTLREHGGRADADEIEQARRELSRRTAKKPLVLYRWMRLPLDFVVDELQAGAELGQSWTTDRNMPTDNLYDMNTYPDEEMFIFEVHASDFDIAAAHTVAFNILFPEENEVFLLPRARLRFVAVYEEGMSGNLRDDLTGAEFGV